MGRRSGIQDNILDMSQQHVSARFDFSAQYCSRIYQFYLLIIGPLRVASTFAGDGDQAQLEEARDAAHKAEQTAAEARALQLTHQKASPWQYCHI